ncbi:hypothetical protein UFOVP16_22 [uncultured Caudovirales phage]|uniref:Uncharacterized protein n=1 Tax=uncultured Caudovirales phage TaxID=2100421 RepID=A0A6J5KNZ0_9CAUD|nr:hypothetical protein UFOVP16_22 [uncultured Caudovirales phage]
MGTVTLINGTDVDSSSEEWRHECEARTVLNWPGIDTRRKYIAAVKARRGEAAGKRLQDMIMILWQERLAGR